MLRLDGNPLLGTCEGRGTAFRAWSSIAAAHASRRGLFQDSSRLARDSSGVPGIYMTLATSACAAAQQLHDGVRGDPSSYAEHMYRVHAWRRATWARMASLAGVFGGGKFTCPELPFAGLLTFDSSTLKINMAL